MAELLDRTGAVQLVQEIKAEVDSITGSMAQIYTGTIGTAWVGNTAPYTQRVTIAGILSTDTPIVDVVPDSEYALAGQQIDCWADIYKLTAIDNGLIAYAHRQMGTAIPIRVVCIRPIDLDTNKFDNANTPIYERYIDTESWKVSSDSASYLWECRPNTRYLIFCGNQSATIFRAGYIEGTIDLESPNDISLSGVVRLTSNESPISITTSTNATYIAIQVNKTLVNNRTCNIRIE